MYLQLSGHSLDGKRQRRFVAENLSAADAAVHRFDYRILDHDRALVQRFRIWTELPGDVGPGEAVPIVPIEFEFKAKSFLALQAVRNHPLERPIATTNLEAVAPH